MVFKIPDSLAFPIGSPSHASFVSNFSPDQNLSSTFRAQLVRRSELMILALISIACFSDVSNSLQAMLICARISNAFGTDAFLHNVISALFIEWLSILEFFPSFLFQFETAGFESGLLKQNGAIDEMEPCESWKGAKAPASWPANEL